MIQKEKTVGTKNVVNAYQRIREIEGSFRSRGDKAYQPMYDSLGRYSEFGLREERREAVQELRQFWTLKSGGKNQRLFEAPYSWDETFTAIKMDGDYKYTPTHWAYNVFALLTDPYGEGGEASHVLNYYFGIIASTREYSNGAETEPGMMIKILHPEALRSISKMLDGWQLVEMLSAIEPESSTKIEKLGERKRLIEKVASSFDDMTVRRLAERVACGCLTPIIKILLEGGDIAQKTVAKIIPMMNSIKDEIDRFSEHLEKDMDAFKYDLSPPMMEEIQKLLHP